MPSYIQDDRHVIDYTVTRTVQETGEFIDRGTYGGYRSQGRVKRFSGPNEGKFIPGQFRVNNMTASRSTYVYGSSDLRFVYDQGYRHLLVDVHGYASQQKGFRASSPAQTWDDSLMGYVVQKAHAQLLSSDLDMGEFLAELPQSISMVRGGVVLLQKAIASASKGGFTWSKADRARRALLSGKSIKRLPRSLANAWLTWRYGIRPLIWDVQGIIREANDFAMKSNFSGLQRRRGRGSKTRTETVEPYFIPVWDRIWLEAKENVEIEQKGEAVVYFSYGADFGPISYILQKYGLHPSQFPYLLWQLVPLSFMLDWFVDVGTWVQAITPKWQFTIHGCSASQKTSMKSDRICTASVSPPYSAVGSGTIHDQLVVECIDRRRQTLSGVIPHLKPKIILSIQKQADLLSVLLQRALNHRRH